jgi:hypothetical protein
MKGDVHKIIKLKTGVKNKSVILWTPHVAPQLQMR